LRAAGVGVAGAAGTAAVLVTNTTALADSDESGLAGAWLENLSSVNGTDFPPFQVLVTYAAGGGMVATASIDEMKDLRSSPTHGAWKSLGARSFAWTGHAFSLDNNGNPSGTYNIKERLTVAPGGNTYAGSGTFEIVNNGAVVFPSTPYKTTAVRITT
jgi:hypothetical protein